MKIEWKTVDRVCRPFLAENPDKACKAAPPQYIVAGIEKGLFTVSDYEKHLEKESCERRRRLRQLEIELWMLRLSIFCSFATILTGLVTMVTRLLVQQ